MSRIIAIIAATLLFLLPGLAASADTSPQLAQSDTAIEKVFSDLERRVIREVLGAAGVDTDEDDNKGKRKAGKGKGGKGAPPGLAKRDQLPPGLQKQLQRNGRLPPGLEKREFPRHLRVQLPSPLQGTERILVDNDAVLIEKGTNIILDVIHDVVRNKN